MTRHLQRFAPPGVFTLALSALLVLAPALSLAEENLSSSPQEEAVEVGASSEAGPAVEPDRQPSPELGIEGMAGLTVDDFSFDDLDIQDELALLYAEDIVISATRHEQRISESPSTITVISRDDLASGWYRDLADVLRMVPGGEVFRINPMTVNVGLRAGTTGIANRVLLLVDGRDMAVQTTGQPQWTSLSVDLDSIERIEVIRGPGSSIYGANALQGVVNIITRRPTDEPLAVEGSASIAGPTTHNADARAYGKHGALRWWANAGYDQESLFENPDRLGSRTLRLRGRFDLDVNDRLEASVEAGYGGAKGRFASPAGDAETIWTAPYLLTKLRWPSSEVQLSLESSSSNLSPGNHLIAPAGSLGAEPLNLGSFAPLDLHSRSVELTAFHSFVLRGGHRLMIGGAGRALHHVVGAVLRCPEVEKTDFQLGMCEDAALNELRGGVFAQAELRLAQTLGLTTGLRADVNSIHPQIGLSPRLAMVWTPRRDQALRASAGRAYRKPSFFESHLSFRFTPGDEVPGEIASRLQYLFAVDAPNPNLGNETVTAVEAGWLGRFLGGRLVTTVDLYHLSFEQRIEGILENMEFIPGLGGSVSLHPDARISYANQDMPQWALGGELALSARPTAWLRLDAHYSHQGIFDVEEADGERVSTISTWTPQHRFNFAARLDLSGGLRLGISAHWCSAFTRYLQDPESSLYPLIYQEIGNQVLVLGSASYLLRLPRGEVEVGVGGRNLLFAELRESPGISGEEGAWGGEILRPSARLFVRGRF